MSLIACSECGKEFSSLARTCPGCGAPARISRPPKKMMAETIVLLSIVIPPVPLLLVWAFAMAAQIVWLAGLAGSCGILYVIWSLAVAPIVIGDRLGFRRGHRNIGALIGFLAGWIGVLIYWLVTSPLPATPVEPPIPAPPLSPERQATYEAWAAKQERLEGNRPIDEMAVAPPPPPPPRLAERRAGDRPSELR